MTMYSRDAADRLLLVARKAAETVKIESAHLAELAETIIALHDRLSAPPRIIRTLADLESIDPDTILSDSVGPYAAGEGVGAIYEDDDEGRDYLPAVVIATGDQTRAARQTLEEA